jgi:hypothetical protein
MSPTAIRIATAFVPRQQGIGLHGMILAPFDKPRKTSFSTCRKSGRAPRRTRRPSGHSAGVERNRVPLDLRSPAA